MDRFSKVSSIVVDGPIPVVIVGNVCELAIGVFANDIDEVIGDLIEPIIKVNVGSMVGDTIRWYCDCYR